MRGELKETCNLRRDYRSKNEAKFAKVTALGNKFEMTWSMYGIFAAD
jgi:hypothetical protein